MVALATVTYFWVRKASMTQGLILANLFVFILTIVTGNGLNINGSPLLDDLAARSSYLTEQDWPRMYTFVTAAFLHADFLHLLGNLLVLYLLGLPFEDRVGRGRFLLVYFWGAIIAVVLHSLWVLYQVRSNPALLPIEAEARLDVPLVGASGAVFGVLGAFATRYPRDEVTVPLVFIILPRVPVYIAAVLLTFFEAFFLFGSGTIGRVAHAAHIGGAIGGSLMALVLRPPKAAGRMGPSRIDYQNLERLATEPRQREWLGKLRENEEHPEIQRAWLEKLGQSLRCPACGQPYAHAARGRLICVNGHEERYAL